MKLDERAADGLRVLLEHVRTGVVSVEKAHQTILGLIAEITKGERKK